VLSGFSALASGAVLPAFRHNQSAAQVAKASVKVGSHRYG